VAPPRRERQYVTYRGTGEQRNGLFHAWTRRLLRLYPRAWRERYAPEMELVLAQHRVTLWTALDVGLGALDAHLHSDWIPGRLTSMTHRIRTSEIAIFCACVLYMCVWLGARLVRDPLTVWDQAVRLHPEIRAALMVMDGASGIALLAVAAGGVPMLVVALGNAVRDWRWKILTLLAVPVVAIAALVIYLLLAAGLWAQQVSNSGPPATLTPLAFALQLGFLLLLLAAIAGSTVAVGVAIGQSSLSAGLVRFALIPATVATGAIAVGLVAACTLTVLILAEAPQLQIAAPAGLQVAVTVMAGAVVAAALALRRGWGAARAEAA
jgi:hypothetical protein